MVNVMEIASELAAYRRRLKLLGDYRESALKAILRTEAIFVHIPKTGGKTVIKDFYGLPQHYWFGHAKPDFYKALLGPRRYRNFFKFSIVRDPVDRCRSGFFFGKGGGFDTEHDQEFAKFVKDMSFDEFILDGHLEQWSDRYIFEPQSSYLVSEGQMLVDRIYYTGRLERLFRDLKMAVPEISHENRSQYKKHKLDQKIVEKIRSVYRKDYEVIDF